MEITVGTPVTEKGIYQHDGEVYRVKIGMQSKRPYAMRMVPTTDRLTDAGFVVQWDFEYAPGAVRYLTAEMRLSLEEALALSIRYEHCIMCGRFLKAAESVDKAIGPVCRKYFR